MTTNIELNDKLVEEALKVGKHKTKNEVINAALKEYVKLKKQKKIKELFGTIVYEKSYDYKAQRKKQ